MNPWGSHGVINHMSLGGSHNIQVLWDNGFQNCYREMDLDLMDTFDLDKGGCLPSSEDQLKEILVCRQDLRAYAGSPFVQVLMDLHIVTSGLDIINLDAWDYLRWKKLGIAVYVR